MKKPHTFKVGDIVRVVKVPPSLHDAAGIGTPEVFADAVGKTFRIEGFSEYGHLELFVRRDGTADDGHPLDSIWIEPGFVEAADDATPPI
jgi:hypothetical protein